MKISPIMYIRPRWRKVLADLWSNKARSILVVLSISVGLFAVGMIANIHGVLIGDMVSGYQAVNPANITISTSSLDKEFADTLEKIEGVQAAETVRAFSARLVSGTDEYVRLNLKAVPNMESMTINRPILKEGVFPPKDKEIVLDQHRLSETNARVGDMVQIRLSSGKIRQLRLVGVVQDQTIGAVGIPYFVANLQGYITYDSLKWMEQPELSNMVYVITKEGKEDVASIKITANQVVKKVEQNNRSVLSTTVRRSSEHPNLVYVEAISATLFLLGFLVVFLSGFLITNTLSALLNQQVEQIGTMKTFGGNRRQISQIYIVLILVYSFLGLLISLFFSGQAAYWLLMLLSREINCTIQGFRQVPLAILLQILMAIIVPSVSGFIPIMRSASMTIQETYNGTGIINPPHRNNLLEFFTNRMKLPRPMILSLRNTFRRRARLALTLITLTMGGAIFIATFNVQSSMEDLITSLGKYFIADVNVSMDRPYRNQLIEQAAMSVPGVVEVEGWATSRVEILDKSDNPGESVNLLAPPANSKLVEPMVTQGRWIQPGDRNAITLNELFKVHYPNTKVGDSLHLRVNGKKTTWEVVGFFQYAGKNGGYIAYTSYEYLTEIISQTHKAITFQVVSSKKMDDIDNQKDLALQIENTLAEMGYQVSDIRPGLSLLESASAGLNVLTLFLFIMALLAALVGSIGLAGTLSMNVLERTREIAVMRAIGATDNSVMRLVIVEGLVIGLISWFLGGIIGFPISKALWDVISFSVFGFTSTLSISATGFGVWLLAVIILTVAASLLPARNAARLTIREALAYE